MVHDPRPLSERFDLTYVRRRHWPFNWIVPATVVLIVLVGLYLASTSLLEDHRVHSPGPLTHAHEMFENDCAACHRPDPERSGYWLPVRDDACLACHIAAAHPDPHAKLFAGETTPVSDYLGKVTMSSDCAACHIEHNGRTHDLNKLSDRSCVQCHGDLGAYADIRWPADHTIDNNITDFADGHPEFDVLARGAIDDTPLKFEHATHMNPTTGGMQDRLRKWLAELEQAGVPHEQIAVAAFGSRQDAVNPDTTLTLTCTACHQPDDDGRYMKPISFEQHCRSCHSMGTQLGESVPHGSGIHDFIARLAARTAIEPPKRSAPPGGKRGGPGGRGGPPGKSGPPSRGGPPARGAGGDDDSEEPQTIALDELQNKVDEQTESLAKDILVTAKCMQCHGPVKSPADIVDPDIPDRWMTRGRFGHQAHRFISCVTCHPQADGSQPTESYPGEDDPDSPAARLKWTMHTRDVMLPSIDDCRQCHSPAARRTAGGAARHDCVMCHIYHGTESDPVTRHALPANPRTIATFLRKIDSP